MIVLVHATLPALVEDYVVHDALVELKLSSRATVAIWSGGTSRAGGWEPLRNGDRISVMEAAESQWKVVLIPGLTPKEPLRSLNVVQRITISGGEQT